MKEYFSGWTVIGQDRAVSLLQRSLEIGSLAHAYLFAGPAGVGKMTLALNLAQALNCEAAETPCGQCASCQKIVSNKHADVQVIGLNQSGEAEGAKPRAEISIDSIRQVQHSASLPPFEGRFKVFIVDGAEFLSTEAANCLLKTLEEPAEKAVFILLTANERFLLTTVISRCQRVELLPLAPAELETALEEKWGIEPARARLLARLSRGCPGWAISAALDDGPLQQRNQALDRLIDITNADCEERFAYAAQLATQFSQNRQLVQARLDLWLGWWRDLLLTRLGCNDYITNIDRAPAIIDASRGYSPVQIKTFIRNIQAAGEQLKQNVNPQLALEVLMLGIPETGRHHDDSLTVKYGVNYG